MNCGRDTKKIYVVDSATKSDGIINDREAESGYAQAFYVGDEVGDTRPDPDPDPDQISAPRWCSMEKAYIPITTFQLWAACIIAYNTLGFNSILVRRISTPGSTWAYSSGTDSTNLCTVSASQAT